jgi:hypothetical protein
MTSSIDLNLLFLARQVDGDKFELPDLYAVTPPHRTARGREADSLVIYLSMTGNSPLSPEAHSQLLVQLAQKFYKTSGSLTAALRTIAEGLNLFLLDRNLRSTSMGRQGLGQLLLLALRGDTLYMAQSGMVEAFLLSPGKTQALYDLQTSGRGLGLSRSMPIRFVQVKMSADDYLVLSTIAASAWSAEMLKYPSQQGIDSLRHQLLATSKAEFNVVIVQAETGSGRLRLLRPRADAAIASVPSGTSQPGFATTSVPETGTQSLSRPGEDKGLGIPLKTSLLEPPLPQTAQAVQAEQPEARPDSSLTASAPSHDAVPPQEAPLPTAAATSSEPFGSTQQENNLPEKISQIRQPKRWANYLASFRTALGPIWKTFLHALQSALRTIGAALLRLLKSLLPDADVLRMPPSVMVFIAIAIPVILAVIGGMVFLKRGRTQQSAVYYQQAVEAAEYADTLTNPLEQRLAWQNALGKLDLADEYIVTSQSKALRAQVTSNLDTLNAVTRLDYQQAIVDGLESGVNITRIIATTIDLYMLNATDGSVFHAILTSRGYELDPNFQCGPTNGPINVGPFVDIAELPSGSYENASLLGMDANGNLLYCIVGGKPYSATLAPPNTGLGEPKAISLDRGDLYVLDPQVNAVWIYRNMEVTQQPRLFFGDMVPPMQDVIDIAVYNNDLFLLHADGHATKCTYSGMLESPTRCDDPYPYSDNRPGRLHGPVIEDTNFNQIYFSSFPERSIYTLDPHSQAIYYFSLLLAFQWQYQPLTPLVKGDATAFAINPNRTAFLAISNSVYYAALP